MPTTFPAVFSHRYPDHTAPTLSLDLSRPPVPGSSFPRDEGVVRDVMADGKTFYAYENSAEEIQTFDFEFQNLTNTDRSNFNAFIRQVIGQPFEILDPSDQTTWVLVYFDGFTHDWKWDGGPAEPWSVGIRYRAA